MRNIVILVLMLCAGAAAAATASRFTAPLEARRGATRPGPAATRVYRVWIGGAGIRADARAALAGDGGGAMMTLSTPLSRGRRTALAFGAPGVAGSGALTPGWAIAPPWRAGPTKLRSRARSTR